MYIVIEHFLIFLFTKIGVDLFLDFLFFMQLYLIKQCDAQ